MRQALDGAERVLLISSSEVRRRVAQHANVITAAKNAGVRLVAYTSITRADTPGMVMAEEHRATEKLLASSGVPYVLLRNSWYTENYATSCRSTSSTASPVRPATDGSAQRHAGTTPTRQPPSSSLADPQAPSTSSAAPHSR